MITQIIKKTSKNGGEKKMNPTSPITTATSAKQGHHVAASYVTEQPSADNDNLKVRNVC